MKLSTKIFTGFLILALISGLTGIVGFNGMNSIIELDQITYEKKLSALEEKQILEEVSEKISAQMMTVSVISVIIAIGFGLYFSSLIGIPLKKLQFSTKEIGKGNLDSKFNYTKNDEIGEFAETFNSMTESLKNVIKLEKELSSSKQQIINERFTAIGELSARISHDIRNPLSILYNEFELMKFKNELNEKQINRIESSLKRISHQINDVLDFVRITPLNYSTVNLSKTIKSSLDSIAIPSEIKINIPSDELLIECDERKLEIIFINLILNSVQAIENNGIIDVIFSSTKTFVTIEIKDSGPGISVDPIENIFNALVTTKQKGTGLGLASVKNLIEQHKGEISVKNNPTTFTIKIPVKEKLIV